MYGLDLAEESESVGDLADTFYGKAIMDYDPAQGVTDPSPAYRVRCAEYEQGPSDWVALFDQFAAQGAAVEALVVGAWGGEATAVGEGGEQVVQAIADAKGKLPNLKAIFLGDIGQEEAEMSWIQTGSFSPLLSAYPGLRHLRVNGNPSAGELGHANLQSLVLQAHTGAALVRALGGANLPELVHLELWLGMDDYGGDASVEDLAGILAGKSFPKLKYLGLRNSEHQDAVAAAAAAAPILEQLEALDLSLGTLSDAGGEALLASPGVKTLKALDLHYNFLTPAVVEKLEALGLETLETDADDAEEDEYDGEVDRYISVGE